LEIRHTNTTCSSSGQEISSVAAHGVFLRDSNGMDVILSPGKLTYKVVGGILDLSIFLGPHPAAVVDQYTELIGRPHMPPAWAMGWHQSRWGYRNIEAVETVVATYQKEDLPLDGVWIDIDYMQQSRDFTYNELLFPQARIKQLASDLANRTQNMVLTIDPAIAVVPGYAPFDEGLKKEVFLMRTDPSGHPTQPVEGRVWPGQTYFPDFLNTNETWAFWERQLRKTREDLGENVYPWLDMNEPSNFCSGECSKNDPATGSDAVIAYEQKRNASTHYSINNAGHEASLEEKTLGYFAVHKNGMRFLDTHNLYGHLEVMATYQALTNMKPEQRPFILSRSTFPGTGE
jgi:alpha-glucosidase (family GH31 glycosyl hydrolase)